MIPLIHFGPPFHRTGFPSVGRGAWPCRLSPFCLSLALQHHTSPTSTCLVAGLKMGMILQKRSWCRHVSDSPSSWGCWDCDHGTFVWPTDGWKCSKCNSREYYQVDCVVRRETEEGVWMFTLHVQSHDHSHRLHEPHPATPSPPSDHRAYGEGSEQAESEVRTIDPIVEPQDESTPRRRNRGRRARRTTAHEDAIRTPAQSQLSHVLQTLQNALANNHQNSHPSREASSNS